ncbi:hypothetical protein [Haloferula sp. A504]|uniref:hypothetical protein n=1 Tax=Haloferula sp. A504 TaxID=3373601 RepID=UPI0031BE204D|nr:hypothetical protein [Verrucomicrobiaceae bacterium E54]
MTNCFIHACRRLSVTQGFIKRSPMFRRLQKPTGATTPELVDAAKAALKSGRLRPGDPFPTADEISDLSGARLIDSLNAVTALLQAGAIRQDASGKLTVAPPEVA